MEPRYVIGIDLGTTNSALAYTETATAGDDPFAPANVQLLEIPQLENPGEVRDEGLLPSFLYLPGATDFPAGTTALPWDAGRDYVTGRLAQKRGVENAGRLVSSAKSWLSHSGVDRTAPLLPFRAPDGVPKISPVDASRRYLEHLREAWDFKMPDAPFADQQVLVTVPASFDAVARELTLEAARLAGYENITLLEEPNRVDRRQRCRLGPGARTAVVRHRRTHGRLRVAIGTLRPHYESVRWRRRNHRASRPGTPRGGARLRVGDTVLPQREDPRGAFALHRVADRRKSEVKLLAVALLLTAGGPVLPAQDLPQWVLNLARIKRQARANFQRLPNYACHETISRSQLLPRGDRFRPLDLLQLEVAVIGGKELYANAGAGQFEDRDLTEMMRHGAINTGSFASLVNNLFVNDNGLTTGWADDAVGTRRALRYDFSIAENLSGNVISNGVEQATTALHGSFWADASTFDLLRIEEHAADIPPRMMMSDITTVIDYQRVKVGESEVLLPSRAEMTITETSGRMARNITEFSGCRQYGSESVIHFGGDEPEGPATTPRKK